MPLLRAYTPTPWSTANIDQAPKTSQIQMLLYLVAQCLTYNRIFAADNSFCGDLYVPDNKACHHFQLAFTNGAGSNNSRDVDLVLPLTTVKDTAGVLLWTTLSDLTFLE
ncbi:hypothetical protein GALMADRAFT_271485 [Galerina marginata CBS 339.88]|uniref:Uncharacterized protein n=1 Tax=Galerina marginata (strain CBS 339.88) TaxID=685588 RepID=A0A067SSR5_GALM3|nr:hypothetical protein GALMADRAFT_271485 [Galerina marginata CBS 339.88]